MIDLHTVTCFKIQPCALAVGNSIFAHAIRSPKLAFHGFKPENLVSSLLVELIQTVFPEYLSLAMIPKEIKRSTIQQLCKTLNSYVGSLKAPSTPQKQ